MELYKENYKGVLMGEIDKELEEKLAELRVNGRNYGLKIKSNWTLAHVLRQNLGFTGLKIACDNGACGACTVLIENEPILSCMKLAIECEGKNITTIEGLSAGVDLHPIQEAWLEEHGTQCGFCAPGMIMTTKALLDKNPNPAEKEVRESLAGNICRCGNYDHIVKSVLVAAKKMKRG
jgi:carbon-monoxide dehydrogenase small subunit